MNAGQIVNDVLVLADSPNVIVGSYSLAFDGTNINFSIFMNAGVYLSRVQITGGLSNASPVVMNTVIDQSYAVLENTFSPWTSIPVPDADGSSSMEFMIELTQCAWN